MFLGLRARVITTFSLISLAVAALVSGAMYVIADHYLTAQRIDSALTRASLDARAVSGALANGASPTDALAYVPIVEGSQAMLLSDGEWFTSTVAVTPDALPDDLLTQGSTDGVQQKVAIAGEPYLVIALPVSLGLFIEVFPLRALDQTLTVGAWALFGVTVVAGALGALLGLYAVRRLFAPLDNLSSGALGLADGRLDTRLPEVGDRDLDPIADAFNLMAEAVQARIQREQRFAANVSHELRSPVTAISGVTELLEEHSQRMRPEDADIIRHLGHQVRRLSRMLVDLLEISRVMSVDDADLEPVDIPRLLRQVVTAQGLPPELVVVGPLVMSTDARSLERIADNAVRNAQSHGHGLRAVSVEERRDSVDLLFDDAGPGFPSDVRDSLFEPFTRGAAAEPASGAGLGLAIALEHASRIGATLIAEDAPGIGARLRVCLPRRETP